MNADMFALTRLKADVDALVRRNAWRYRLSSLRYHLRRGIGGTTAPRRPAKKVFLTFAAGPRFDTRYIVEDVRRLNLFDKIYGLGPDDLGEAFWDRHGAFVRARKRGYGFWIWKPFIIQRCLRAMRDDDILVYSDAGAIVIPEDGVRARLEQQFQDIQQWPVGLGGAFAEGYVSPIHCKADVFAALGVQGEQDRAVPQYEAGRIICRKHPAAMRIIDLWARLAWARRYHLFDNSPSRLPNHVGFREHRHDQAIFSILMHRYGGRLWRHGVFRICTEVKQMALAALAGEEEKLAFLRHNEHLSDAKNRERVMLRQWVERLRQAAKRGEIQEPPQTS